MIVLILCIDTMDGRICVKFTFVIYSQFYQGKYVLN
jgi:hypothetical protein